MRMCHWSGKRGFDDAGVIERLHQRFCAPCCGAKQHGVQFHVFTNTVFWQGYPYFGEGMDGTTLFSLSCEFTEVGYMPSDKDWEACIYQLDEAGRPGEDVTFNMEEDEVPSTVRPFVVLYTTHALKKVSCVPWPCADHCPIVLGRSLHHFDLLLLFVCNGLQKRRSDGLRAQDVAVF